MTLDTETIWYWIQTIGFYGVIVPFLLFTYARMIAAGILSAFESSDRRLINSSEENQDNAAPQRQTNQSTGFRPSKN